MTATWHADGGLLDAYAGGSVDHARAASVEAHLLACPSVGAGWAIGVDLARTEALWAEDRRRRRPAKGPSDRAAAAPARRARAHGPRPRGHPVDPAVVAGRGGGGPRLRGWWPTPSGDRACFPFLIVGALSSRWRAWPPPSGRSSTRRTR